MKTNDGRARHAAPANEHAWDQAVCRIRMTEWLILLLVAVLAAAGVWVSRTYRHRQPHPLHRVQAAASERNRQVMAYLKDVMMRENIAVEPEDILQTGLLGPEFDTLTSSVGHLEAKRSSLNPNFSALLVRLLDEAGLKRGDVVAVGSSGSFPGLTLASLAAAEEMGLRCRVIASLGASMHGATRENFSVARVLREAQASGLLHFDFVALSPGGDKDRGNGVLVEDVRPAVLRIVKETGVPFIDEEKLENSIARRMELFGDDIRLFLNVGGASANVGMGPSMTALSNGLVTRPAVYPKENTRGLAYEYLMRGIPVIHLLNVRGLCAANGLPIDPVPMPRVGEGDVYWVTVYPKAALTGVVCAMAAAVALGAWGKRRGIRRLQGLYESVDGVV